MAANYWTSTQHQFWHFTPSQLSSIRTAQSSAHPALSAQHPLPHRTHLLIFLRDQLLRISRRPPARQQTLATTLTYLHRYLLTTPLQQTNPYLLLTTAFYLSTKTEEAPQHIRLVLSEARQHFPDAIPGDVSRIGETEFSLISEMRSQLIVWHPYRTLVELRAPEADGGLGLTLEETQWAWCFVNDSYLTDLPLTCAPHVIALTAVFMAVVLLPTLRAAGVLRPAGSARFPLPSHPEGETVGFEGVGGRAGLAGAVGEGMGKDGAPQRSEKVQRVIRYLARSTVDLEDLVAAAQEMVTLYEVWESYNEREVRDALAKLVRARGLDK